jgi:hypothetical protein
MTFEKEFQYLIKFHRLTGSYQEISDELRKIYCSKRAMFMEQTNFFGNPLFVYVFESGLVCLIFKDQQYLFENPFGKHLSGTFQLFVKDNIVVLFSGLMFMSFVFERNFFSKIEYKSYQAWSYKRFVKGNVILLSIGRMILSFTLENGRFTMRYYPIRHVIDGGILTFVEGTPYFVCCIHPHNSPLIVVSINLITGQQNTVLEIGEDEYFISFQMNDDGSLSITTISRGDYTTSVVDPLIIHDPRESWRQDGGILWDRVDLVKIKRNV